MDFAKTAKINMKKILIVIAILLIGGFLIQNKNNFKGADDGKLKVTTSFYPLFFFSGQIGGDKANIYNITPAGAEPHDYDPSTQDIARIENSSLIVLNGGVEAWGDKIRQTLLGKNKVIVVAGEKLLTRQLEEEGQAIKDPHVWLDPALAKEEVGNILAGFEKVDPINKSYYEQNAKTLDSKLDQLDTEYKNGLASCQNKDIITSHAAFGYLASRYGLNQVPIAGLSPDEEPSSKQLAQVSGFAKKNGIKYIFFESLVSPKLSDTIAKEVGAKTLVLDPLEGIGGEDIKAGKDYFSVMRQNLANLQIALQCNK